MDLLGKAGGTPDFSNYAPGCGVCRCMADRVVLRDHGAPSSTSSSSMPYTKAKEKYFPAEEAGTPADVALLEEIRDLLKAQQGGAARRRADAA